jgi:nucleoside-diphosphate-sugar epimerase
VQKKIVITGGAGYIGSTLSRMARARGYEVHVVDRFFFGSESLEGSGVILHRADTRDMDPSLLEGAFALFDLAAISNDPAGDLNKAITMDINYRARRRLQELCLENGVERYVLASSCSVYGFQDQIVDEKSDVNPLTTYAEANILAENSAFSILGGHTAFTSLRQATVFGLSNRMRFDLAVNAMTLSMWKSGKLRILRNGEQWRPMVHLRDTSKAFLQVIEAERELVDGEIFNVGSDHQNFRIIDLAEEVSAALGKELELEWYGDPDHRSYRVSFQKINKVLNFETEWTVGMAAKEIADALGDGAITDSLKTQTLNWYQSLMEWEELLNITSRQRSML